MSGVFGTVAYNSISATFSGPGVNASNSHFYANDQFAYEAKCSDGGGNPYTAGERSVFAAAVASRQASLDTRRRERTRDRRSVGSGSSGEAAVSIPIYRPDAASSLGYDFDGIPNGPANETNACSDYYLSTIRTSAEEDTATLPPFLLLRVRVPGVFVRSSSEQPDEVFEPTGEYEARYWSVSSHYGDASYPSGLPDAKWWTVSARMVNDAAAWQSGAPGSSSGGSRSSESEEEPRPPSLVLFLPAADAIALQTAQGLPTWQAPMFRAAGVSALVLPSPDFVVFRWVLVACIDFHTLTASDEVRVFGLSLWKVPNSGIVI